MGKQYMSIRETARETGLSEYYIRTKVKNNEIPHLKSGNKVLIDLEALKRQNEKEYSSEKPEPQAKADIKRVSMEEAIMRHAKTEEEGIRTYERWKTFAALKLIEQLNHDGKVSGNLLRRILMDYSNEVDITLFRIID